ncbi:MAG: transglutaminase-like domain-containing protein [Lachnospiraceae bacterium]|nr:transglutaminase-like domain-containing protein [Lachnospiraceae bacterium]
MSHRALPTFLCLSVTVLLFTSGCDSSAAARASASSVSDASTRPETDSSASRWDNTPKVLVPQAGSSPLLGNASIQIDISNSKEGYICASYRGSSDKIKFFVVTPDQTRYTYDIGASDDWSVLPLTGGDGTYTFDVREHVQDDVYSNLYCSDSEVTLKDEFCPFLYPNQYTWFTEDSAAVQKASQLAADASDGIDVISNIYNYVIKHVTYDSDKAAAVQSGYLPDVDETLASGKGICFDYAALMTAMLRSQGIPTKLEIGYSGEVYHAWISTWLAETGWVDHVIEFDGTAWSLMDPTLAASNDASAVKKYIGDGTNYVVKYSR